MWRNWLNKKKRNQKQKKNNTFSFYILRMWWENKNKKYLARQVSKNNTLSNNSRASTFFVFCHLFTFSSHTEYVKRESIIIAWVKKKKFSHFDKCSCFVCLRRQYKQQKMSVCLSVWMSVRTYVHGLFMWTQ